MPGGMSVREALRIWPRSPCARRRRERLGGARGHALFLLCGAALSPCALADSGEGKVWAALAEPSCLLWGGFLAGVLILGLLFIVRRLAVENTRRRQAEQRYRNLLLQAPEAIFIYESEGQCWHGANAQARRLTGYSEEAIASLKSAQLFADADADAGAAADADAEPALRQAFEDHLRRALAGEEVLTECALRCQDGSAIACELRVWKMPDETPPCLRASVVDIRQRKSVESELADYRAQLEAQIVKRTAELQAALAQAEAASRAKSTFLSNMSHELRTPLNAVIGFSRLLSQSDHLDAAERKQLEIITQSGSHLRVLIDTVLELSKIEAGYAQLREENTDLPALLHEVTEMLQTRADQGGVALALRCVDLPRGVRVDAMKLRQVLINLLGNALKFTRQGTVLLSVAAQAVDAARAQVEFKVSDTGIGIPLEDRARIFDPFVQGETPARGAGTGLGLTLSKQYISVLGGDLCVDSEPGRGSEFSFVLVLPVVAIAKGVSEGAEAMVLSPAHYGRRILIVEDDPLARELLVAWLKPLGFALAEAEDGEAALGEVDRFSPELIIMDWRMPRLDGLAATRRIRARSDLLPQPKIVMLTANAFEEERQLAVAAGVDEFLRKPVLENVLFAAIGRLFGLETLRVPDDVAHGVALSPEEVRAIAAVGAAQRAAIGQAVEELNRRRINAVLAEIEPEHPVAARAVARLADAFQFKPLWELLATLRAPR